MFQRDKLLPLIAHAAPVLLVLAALSAMPAMRHLGYPLAVATTAPCVLFGLYSTRQPRSAWQGFGLAWLIFAVIVEPVWGCDTVGGLVWLAQGPLLGALFGYALSAWFRQALGLRRGTLLAACALFIIADLGAMAWRLYSQPQVMVIDPLIGFVHGPIYDEWVPIEAHLLRARAALLALSGALIWRAYHPQALGRFGNLILATTLLCSWPGHYLPGRDDLVAALPKTASAPGLNIHFATGKANKAQAQRILKEAETHISHLSAITLGRPLPPKPVTIWLYPNAEAKRRLMGAGHVFIARPWQNEIHLHPTRKPDPHLRHELVHALLAHRTDNAFGVPLNPLPNPALVEGMAVYLAPGRQRLSLHQAAAALKRRGRLPSIDELLSLRFSLQQGRVAYRAVGSLMQFVAQQHGFKVLLAAYEAGSLQAAGLNTDAVTQAWLAVLDNTADPPQARRNLLRAYSGEALLQRPCPNEVEAAWRHAHRRAKGRDEAQIEADYRAVMRLSGSCRSLASLADRLHRKGLQDDLRRIEDEMLQRGLPSTVAATLFERRADAAIAVGDFAKVQGHVLRALAAAPPEHRYRGLLVRSLLGEQTDLLASIAPYLNTGKNYLKVRQGLIEAYPSLSGATGAAAAYLLMRSFGNHGNWEDAEAWGLRAEPLPRTLAIETQRYLAAMAERAKRPCLAAKRWRKLARQRPAVGDLLDEHLARLAYHHPKTACVALASPKAP